MSVVYTMQDLMNYSLDSAKLTHCIKARVVECINDGRSHIGRQRISVEIRAIHNSLPFTYLEQ